MQQFFGPEDWFGLLATAADVPNSQLFAIESGDSSGSIAALRRIAKLSKSRWTICAAFLSDGKPNAPCPRLPSAHEVLT